MNRKATIGSPIRRTLIVSTLAGTMTSIWAQKTQRALTTTPWPSRPLRILVGFPAGSSPDLTARTLSEPLSRAMGQPVIVENKPGASGNIAADLVAKATDEHTIGLLSVVNLTTAKMLYSKLPYDPSDFAPLTVVGTSPLVLVAPAALVDSPEAFLLQARNQGDKWSYGSPGNGTVGHIGMELIKLRAGLKPVHIPFQGVPQILNSLVSGQIQMALIPVGQALPQLKAGRIKLIGSSAASRSPLAPELSTLKEAGVMGVDLEVWNALAAPKSMASANTLRLQTELQRIIRSAEVRQQLFAQGWQAHGTSPEAMRNMIRSYTTALGGVIQMGNIRIE